jgi:hypothetical protein
MPSPERAPFVMTAFLRSTASGGCRHPTGYYLKKPLAVDEAELPETFELRGGRWVCVLVERGGRKMDESKR